MHQRHSVVGVLTLHRAQSDWLPASPAAPPGSRAEGRHLTLRKAVSEERPQKSSGGESASSAERSHENERMKRY